MSGAVQILAKEQPQKVYRAAEFFVYSPSPLVAALTDAAPTAQLSVQMQTDADFELLEILQVTDIAGALQTASTRVLPLATIQIQQSGTGVDIMPQPVPLAALSGDGSLPFILPESRIWGASSQMLVSLVRYAVAGTNYNIRLAFAGRKLFF